MQLQKRILLLLSSLMVASCGSQFQSLSTVNNLKIQNEPDPYTGQFKIKCNINVKSSTDDITFSRETEVFDYNDLSKPKSHLVISMPPYVLVAKFIDYTKVISNIDPTYCVSFYNEKDPEQNYCQKENSAAIGNLLKNGLITLPYLRLGLLSDTFEIQGQKFNESRAECFLVNAK